MSGRVAKFLLEMIQGRNQRIFLGATKPMWGRYNVYWDRVNVYENIGVTVFTLVISVVRPLNLCMMLYT